MTQENKLWLLFPTFYVGVCWTWLDKQLGTPSEKSFISGRTWTFSTKSFISTKSSTSNLMVTTKASVLIPNLSRMYVWLKNNSLQKCDVKLTIKQYQNKQDSSHLYHRFGQLCFGWGTSYILLMTPSAPKNKTYFSRGQNLITFTKLVSKSKINLIIIFNFLTCQCYLMSSKPRGYVYIINNEDFKDNIQPKRKGSHVDSRNLTSLFSQLGFKVNCSELFWIFFSFATKMQLVSKLLFFHRYRMTLDWHSWQNQATFWSKKWFYSKFFTELFWPHITPFNPTGNITDFHKLCE